MKTEKAEYGTLGSSTTFDKDALYPLDVTQFKTIADIMHVLVAIGFQFSPTHPEFDKIKHLIDINNPQYPELQKFVDGEVNPLHDHLE